MHTKMPAALCRPLLFLLLVLLTLQMPAMAQQQTLRPMTRLHKEDSPYAAYRDGLCSGLMQSIEGHAPHSTGTAAEGFLQMPVVGQPLLIYIGEKDSTQYMAYASGYRFDERDDAAGRYELFLPRYEVRAKAESHGAYVAQRFAYPDTLAEKGFLIDIDNAAGASGNEDVDISFIDRRTVRAHKRGTDDKDGLYYYARFSHPYSGYNVRREKVTLQDGTVTPRCRAVFYFDLGHGEELSVLSAVSPRSSNEAYALVEGKAPARPLSDARKALPVPPRKDLLAQADKPARPETASAKRNAAATPARTKDTGRKPATGTKAAAQKSDTPFPYLEVTTVRAELRTAFYAALARLSQLPDFRKAATGGDFLRALTSHCPAAGTDTPSPAALDSALTAYAADCIANGTAADKDGSRAAWYALNAIGFAPDTADTLRLARPLFNVARLQLTEGRSLILHTKYNSPANCRIARATLTGTPLANSQAIPLARLLRGGIIEARMEK